MFDTGVRQQFAAFPVWAWGQRSGVSLAVLLPVLVFFLQWQLWYAIQPYAWFLFYPTVFFSVLIGRLRGGGSRHRHQHLAGLVRFHSYRVQFCHSVALGDAVGSRVFR